MASRVSDYVRYDEISDVLASTDLLALLTPELRRQPSYWKWAIIAAHNALQGALVCALHDSIGVSVLTDKSARDVLTWHEHRKGEYPDERLADFLTLLRRYSKKPPAADAELNGRRLRDIQKLHEHFRNNFAHFTPKTWSIEKAGLPRIVGAAIDFIEVAMQQNQILYRLSTSQKRRLKRSLRTARSGLVECSE